MFNMGWIKNKIHAKTIAKDININFKEEQQGCDADNYILISQFLQFHLVELFS